jgi:multidrug efflux pump subunit AcrA (membrane-fusion protein)
MRCWLDHSDQREANIPAKGEHALRIHSNFYGSLYFAFVAKLEIRCHSARGLDADRRRNALRTFKASGSDAEDDLHNVAQSHVEALERAAQEQAEKAQAERDAAQRAAAERQAQLAEAKQQADADAAQKKAEQEAALERAQQEAKADEEARLNAEREAALKREEEERQSALAEAARAMQESACKNEQDRLTSLQAAGSKARDDLTELEQGLTCERLRPLVVAAIDRANAMPDVNTPEQVRSAQQELARLGCFSGAVDGSLSAPTKAAVERYQK